MAQNPSELDAINLRLTTMTNLIQEKMYANFIRRSPWNVAMLNSAEWVDGIGDTGRTNVFQPTYMNPDWQNVQLSSLSTDPALNVNATGGQEYSFSRQIVRLSSELIDVTRLRQAWQYGDQLKNIVEQLIRNVGNVWSERYRKQYLDCASYKIIPTANGLFGMDLTNGDITTMPEIRPAAALNSAIMDQMYELLEFESAQESSAGSANGAPVYLCITSRNTIDFILQGDGNIRQDYRFAEATWGQKESTLMNQYGLQKVYRGFSYLMDSMNPRYDFVDSNPAGQKWVRIEPYIKQPATTGFRYVQNPAYVNAPYEDTYIFVKDVYRNLVPRPVSSVGQAKFNPETFGGEVRWINNADMNANFLGTQGFFVASLSNGAQPIQPRHGIVIRHIRTRFNVALVGADGKPVGSLLTTPANVAVAGL